MMNLKKQLSHFDFWLIIAVCILSVFGIICIGSATHINLGEDPSNFYTQIIWFLIGIGVLFLVSFLDLEYISQFFHAIYILNLALLVLVLILGTEVNGAVRWIRIGPASIQPSEFAKVIMIFCLAKLIDKKKERINNISILIMLSIYAAVPVLLIQAQPSLSSSLVIMTVFFIELFVAGLSYKLILKVCAVVVPIGTICLADILRPNPLIMDKILKSYQITRITSMFRPDSNQDTYYQTLKSINAIGSGQLSGKGLYQGTLNQLSYLPEPHNDFIFSVIGEEFGFIGCILVLIFMLFIIFRCILIAMETRDLFGQLIVAGVAGMFGFQTFVNVGVATGIMPNTGMSLPFVSYGGSSMWANMAAIGLVLNIGLKRSKSLFEGV